MRTTHVRAAVAAVAILAGATAAPASAADALTQLARRYAPVVRLVAQSKPCGHGEPFEPTDVGDVLGNPDVALRGPWSGANIVKVAPTANDLSKGLFEYNLDFPGNALAPRCTYDKWSHEISAASRPTDYAHAVTEPSHGRRRTG